MHGFSGPYRWVIILSVLCIILGFGPLPASAQQRRVAAARLVAAPLTRIDYETAHTERRLHAVRASGKMVLDGRLDEAAWPATTAET
jgi:hypothetical protein